jgi:DNA-binding transcriptional LysR family regulator
MTKPDLNLLVIFDAIMQEQSISAAAQRLAMTQPSVSNAVARMRHHWKEPLFVKQGRGIQATPFAQTLWQQIAQPLRHIQEAIAPSPFIPAQAKRRFRIALTDGISALLWPPLRQVIETRAPGVDIHAVPYKGNGESLLLQAEVDLVFDYYSGTCTQIHRQWMFDNHFVCVMGAHHPLADTPLSLSQFTGAEHLLVSLSGQASGIVDTKLAELGLTRRIAMTVNSFSAAIALLQQSNLITVLPYPVVAHALESGQLFAAPPPLSVPPARISMAWHRRQEQDVGLRWLRTTLERIVDEHRALLGHN